MRFSQALLMFVSLIAVQVSLAAQNFSSLEDISREVNYIFAENMFDYAKQIRQERNDFYEKTSDEALFVNRNCGPASRLLLKDLKGLFHQIRKVETKALQGHVYLEAKATVNDRIVDVIIDPTYRQFYRVAVSKKIRSENGNGPIEGTGLVDNEILDNYPVRVLVVESKQLRSYLEASSPYLPEWMVPLYSWGRPASTYQQFYKRYQ